MYGNLMLVPGAPGKMQRLHPGFTCETDEGFLIVFIQGNLRQCRYFMILPRVEATMEIKMSRGKRSSSAVINCPLFDRMMEAKDGDHFKSLKTSGSIILHKRPNHLLIH